MDSRPVVTSLKDIPIHLHLKKTYTICLSLPAKSKRILSSSECNKNEERKESPAILARTHTRNTMADTHELDPYVCLPFDYGQDIDTPHHIPLEAPGVTRLQTLQLRLALKFGGNKVTDIRFSEVEFSLLSPKLLPFNSPTVELRTMVCLGRIRTSLRRIKNDKKEVRVDSARVDSPPIYVEYYSGILSIDIPDEHFGGTAHMLSVKCTPEDIDRISSAYEEGVRAWIAAQYTPPEDQ